MSAVKFSVKKICRYPVKGFSGQELEKVEIETGKTIPWDRAFAIENGPSDFNENNPEFIPKHKFLTLMKIEKLAEVRTEFIEDSKLLNIYDGGKLLVAESLATEIGRRRIELALESRFEGELLGPLRILNATGHSFSDVPEKVVHMVNLNTLWDMESSLGIRIDPLRFRANLYIDGLPAWHEFELVGKCITNGKILLKGLSQTTRCAATNVNPSTGKRDTSIPNSLMQIFGHSDCGIYLQVREGGSISIDSLFEQANG